MARTVRLSRAGAEAELTVTRGRDGAYTVAGNGWSTQVSGVELTDGTELSCIIDGQAYQSRVVQVGADVALFTNVGERHFTIPAPAFVTAAEDAMASDVVLAPMNGAIQDVLVQPGDVVTKGQPLVVMLAMKMETVLKAPRDGVVATVGYGIGDQVALDAFLVTLQEEDESEAA